jgi:hypothetical protein
MLEEFQSLPIWRVFDSKNKSKYNIEEIANFALPLLDQYYKAFPKYTLHNRQHQKNILKIIGELLGDKIEDLTALECVFIILSAFFHDIGMVFNEKQLKNIQNEESFEKFIDANYKAKLQYINNGSVISSELAEWYCRWMHAKRVWLFLDILDKYPWKGISLRTKLGDICESHNEDVSTLNDEVKFETEFLGEADLRFCSVLLRLGDILDFDNSRTPESVYEFLDLDNPKNNSDQISNDEWNKHLCSNGFKIEHADVGVDLLFVAGPKHPQVEDNIHTFLDVIEDELRKCSVVTQKCSTRWRDFKLPLSINRKGIQSQNYTKGDYKLSLDETQIIKLLAGENLYDDEFVFVRELLQNAIDTSRMREFYEKSKGVNNFKSKPIEISTWVDALGYRWVRFDDYGMGLNEYVIKHHLLKKGNSYYNSDYFRIQKHHFKQKTDRDFTPISRFGIGLLSCFLLGDRIEINTRSVAVSQTNANEEQIRLSITGLQGNYFMQTAKEKHVPLRMPNKYNSEEKFRGEYGTSFTVRIDRKKDFIGFEGALKQVVQSHIICSPIEIKAFNEKVGVDFDFVLNTPLAEKRSFKLSFEDTRKIESLLGKEIIEDIIVEFLPIEISKTSESENLKGQFLFIRLTCNQFVELLRDDDSFSASVDVNHEDGSYIQFNKSEYNQELRRAEQKVRTVNIQSFVDEVLNKDLFESLFAKEYSRGSNPIILIHNGVTVPNYFEYGFYSRGQKLNFGKNVFSYNDSFFRSSPSDFCAYFGIVYLQDELIPELAVARNHIKRLAFSIYSNLFFATKQLNDHIPLPQYHYNYIDNLFEDFTFAEVYKDGLVEKKIWNSEKVVYCENRFRSIDEVKDIVKTREVEILIPGAWDFHPNRSIGFLQSLVSTLIQLNFELEYLPRDSNNSYFILKSLRANFAAQPIDKFRPLLFVPFKDSSLLSYHNRINSNHRLTQWMLSNQDILIKDLEGYFISLLRCIQNGKFDLLNSIIQHFRQVLPAANQPNFDNITEGEFKPV